MAIVDSLKKLLVKFGGNPSALEENATSSDVIDAITEAYTDKEGTYTEVTPVGSEGTKIATITTNNTPHDIYAPKELPAVTSEDEGDVLGVNSSGEWVKTTPSSGSNDFIVNLTTVALQESPWTRTTCDKSINDIVTAYNSGKNVIAFESYEGHYTNKRLTCTTAYSEENVGADVLFLAMMMVTGGDYLCYAGIKGRIVDGVDTWNSVMPVWDNS